MHDFAAACEGHEAYHAPQKGAGRKGAVLARDEVHALRRQLDDAVATERRQRER
ncbi:MAG: hypothetical protein AB7E70_20970 [Hyphomicrobiaceae bacterium]